MNFDDERPKEEIHIFKNKDLRHIRKGGVERSLDAMFPDTKENIGKKYPRCMQNPNGSSSCKICERPRHKFREMMKGLCRRCYQLERKYEDKDLVKLAATRIKLAKMLNVRPQ